MLELREPEPRKKKLNSLGRSAMIAQVLGATATGAASSSFSLTTASLDDCPTVMMNTHIEGEECSVRTEIEHPDENEVDESEQEVKVLNTDDEVDLAVAQALREIDSSMSKSRRKKEPNEKSLRLQKKGKGFSAREFKRLLDIHDPRHEWCGLRRVVLPSGHALFLCPACVTYCVSSGNDERDVDTLRERAFAKRFEIATSVIKKDLSTAKADATYYKKELGLLQTELNEAKRENKFLKDELSSMTDKFHKEIDKRDQKGLKAAFSGLFS